MANLIWKHKLELVEYSTWEAHDASETRTEQRTIRMVPTGHEEDFPLDGYISTVLTHGDVFVWHFFEITE